MTETPARAWRWATSQTRIAIAMVLATAAALLLVEMAPADPQAERIAAIERAISSLPERKVETIKCAACGMDPAAEPETRTWHPYGERQAGIRLWD